MKVSVAQKQDPAALAVIIPARDEERLLGACLRSVLLALEPLSIPTLIVLVAHRCGDGTAALARRVLGQRGLVVEDRSSHVAQARGRGTTEALRHFTGTDPAALWLLSTDADSTVSPDWAATMLRHADGNVAAIAGLTTLDSWHELPIHGQRAYQDLISAGIDGDTHHHAYAANLAVRADAYLDVGGWPAVINGEEHALLAALSLKGWTVRRPIDVTVTTSGRRAARAVGGLADLLETLAHQSGSARTTETERSPRPDASDLLRVGPRGIEPEPTD